MPTRAEFEAACVDQRKAKTIEAAAKTMKEKARLVILAYARDYPDEFGIAPDSESGKTIVYTPTIVGVKQVRVTHPEKAALPARFDDERTEEAVRVLDDVGGGAVDALFEKSYKFRGPEAVVEFAQHNPNYAGTVASILLPFTLPAKDAEAMSPRVEVT